MTLVNNQVPEHKINDNNNNSYQLRQDRLPSDIISFPLLAEFLLLVRHRGQIGEIVDILAVSSRFPLGIGLSAVAVPAAGHFIRFTCLFRFFKLLKLLVGEFFLSFLVHSLLFVYIALCFWVLFLKAERQLVHEEQADEGKG